MEIEILLIRHGEAVEEAPGLGDEARWLTSKGRKVSKRVARWLAKRVDRNPVEIWTSPLVRAVQTAEIVADRTRPREVKVCAELAPTGDPDAVIRLISAHEGKGPLALVGHEPQLSLLAHALLGDVEWEGFRKSGVLGVVWEGSGPAKMRFLLLPKDLEVKKRLPRKEAPEA